MKSFKDINFPSTYKYSSDSDYIPLEFYEEAFPIAKQIDLFLGYFSTNAIRVLTESFAEFIYYGGKMRVITNHIFNLKDKVNLFENIQLEVEDKIIDIFSDISLLEKELGAHGHHFFDCLKYLLKEKRLQILPVKFNKIDLAHGKKMILYDGENFLTTDGSINFTLPALIKNSESFEVNAPWNGEIFQKRVSQEIENFEKTFRKEHCQYTYISSDQLEIVINKIGRDKEVQDLLDDSLELPTDVYSEKIKKIKENKRNKFRQFINELKSKNSCPRFPFPRPYEYQLSAYNAWVANSFKGLFAMATGTGKTLTALYCLIEEFNKTKKQKNIFVVPGEELVRQWAEELKRCDFKNIFLWYSKNNKLTEDIENIKVLKNSNAINIVITYDSFQLRRFQLIFKNLLSEYTIIFDEVHNMGALGFKNAIKDIQFNRAIGLSATPLRLWDENDENQFIENLLNAPPPYTFLFPMDEAIKRKFLCPYNYYPFFTNLKDEEFEEYLQLTRKIPFGIDGKLNSYAAIKRQLLLDRASNKKIILLDIIKKLIDSNNFKYTLVYCPKGLNTEDDSEDRLIHVLGENVAERFKENALNVQFFIGETIGRNLLLKDFENGTVDMLFAIKCLDEGVNIPIAQNAIFLASGKNYREFIQRRGRILRKFKSETFEKNHANIYDIVVLPTVEQYNSAKITSKKLIISEFRRLFEFYKMAISDNSIFWKIEHELEKYNLTQYHLEKIIND